MDVGVATSLSRVVGLSGDGVDDNDGDSDRREGGRGCNACSTLGRGIDKAVTGVGVEGKQKIEAAKASVETRATAVEEAV
jgi:hypothetical protein